MQLFAAFIQTHTNIDVQDMCSILQNINLHCMAVKNAVDRNSVCVWGPLRDCQHLRWGVRHCLLNEAKFVPKRPSLSSTQSLDVM